MDKRKAIHLLSERPIDILNPIFKESFGEDYIPLSEMHNEWIHSMVFNPKNETLLAHRNSNRSCAYSEMSGYQQRLNAGKA